MIREIIVWPDPILARKCEPITRFDEDLKHLLTDMHHTMLAARGAGLAAPQVGYALRAITVLVQNQQAKKEEEALQVLKLCNPAIVERRGTQLMREGCLSLPGFFEMVRRSTWVRVEAQDEEGNKVELAGDGKLAHALQHEIEHLDGVVFVDHISLLKRNLARTRFAKAKKKGMRYRADSPTPQDFTELGA